MKIIGANITGSFILNEQDVTTAIQTSNTWSGSVSSDIKSLNDATGSYATTGSNAFVGNQTITGSVDILGDHITLQQNGDFISTIELEGETYSATLAAEGLRFVEASTESFSFGPDAEGGSISSNGQRFRISTNDYNNNWEFDIDGILTVPGDIIGAGNLATTGSNTFSGTQTITGSLHVSSNIVAVGTLTAQTLVVQTITSSVDFVTGSTRFGTVSGNTHQFTGSVSVNGSVTATSFAGSGASLTSIPNSALNNSTISGIALGSNLATLNIGTGLSGTSYNGSTGVTIANTGVTSIIAGAGISIGSSTGTVTITNTINNTNQLTNGAGYITNSTTSLSLTGNLTVSSGNATGGGIILADDGDIVDLNDSFCSMRFSGGVRIFSANRGGSAVIKLGNGGDIVASADITAFGSPSDIRLKENVKPLVSSLDKVLKLQGVTYDWKEETEARSMTNIKEDIGFIAQQVQEVVPELVRQNDNGFLSLRDKGITALLVEAIKEQQTQIEELKSIINGLTK